MTRYHWKLVGGFLVTLGAQIAALEHGWQDALSPLWVGATLGQIGIFVVTLRAPSSRAPFPE